MPRENAPTPCLHQTSPFPVWPVPGAWKEEGAGGAEGLSGPWAPYAGVLVQAVFWLQSCRRWFLGGCLQPYSYHWLWTLGGEACVHGSDPLLFGNVWIRTCVRPCVWLFARVCVWHSQIAHTCMSRAPEENPCRCLCVCAPLAAAMRA